MKKFICSLLVLLSTSAFATGGFECSSNSGKVVVSGAIGSDSTVLDNIYVSHADLADYVVLQASKKMVDYKNAELQLLSDDEGLTRLELNVVNGSGSLNLDLSDMDGGDDILLKDVQVNCLFE